MVSQLVSLLKSWLRGDKSSSPHGQRDHPPGVAGTLWQVLRGSSQWIGLLCPLSAVCQWKLLSSRGSDQPALLTTPVHRKRQLPGVLGGRGIKTVPPGAGEVSPVNVRTEMFSGVGEHAFEQCALSAV